MKTAFDVQQEIFQQIVANGFKTTSPDNSYYEISPVNGETLHGFLAKSGFKNEPYIEPHMLISVQLDEAGNRIDGSKVYGPVAVHQYKKDGVTISFRDPFANGLIEQRILNLGFASESPQNAPK